MRNPDTLIKVQLSGIRNPVRLLGVFLKSMGSAIDESSFEELATLRGDHSSAEAEGLVMRGDNVQECIDRLCELGQFAVVCERGVFYARDRG